MKLTIVFAVLIAAVAVQMQSTVSAQDTKKSPELQVLDRYVGTWLHEVTLLPSKATPKKTTERVIEQTDWVLGESFVMGREVNATNGTKSLWFFTLNRYDKNSYPFWYFDSRGVIGLWNGRWDGSTKTMTFSPTDLPTGWSGVATHKFSTDSYVSAMTMKDGSGRKVLGVHDVKKRQAGIAGKRMLETWSKTGKPPTPLPDELKKLGQLVGTWDSVYEFRVPQRPKAKGVISDQWSLDGRFIMRRETVECTKSIAMIGWDDNQRAYRIARAISNGETNEASGQWDSATRSLVWNWQTAEDSKGVTAIATWRFVGSDAIQLHVVHEKANDVLLDLTIKMKRRK